MNLSIDEKIGQRFIFGVNDKNIDCIIELIEKAYIGGVVLYKNNYSSYNDMLDVVKRIKTANRNNKVPLFIAIDQEGGRVNRMPSDFHLLKNIYDISKYNGELVRDSARITGKMLHNVGVNMNLSPVMDIYDNSKSKVLYKRCFYGDYDSVSNFGKCYINGLKDNNIISVVKHFPGHGASRLDSHFFIPYIFNYKEIFDKHIRPFKEMIDYGCDAVMVGHLVVRKLTFGFPASISSKFIEKNLRNGYDCLIMTDELNMLKKNIFYKFVYIDKALISDNDILLLKIKNFDEGYKIINKYKGILLNNQKYIKKLNDSVMRIIKVKEKYKINDSVEFGNIKVDDINKEIDRINSMIVME